MNDSFGEIMFSFLRSRIPLLFSLLMIMLFCMPISLFEISGMKPQVSFICVYYWVEKKPQFFGLISAFILGLTLDICSTTPVGVNCLVLMVLAFVLKWVFRYVTPASFISDWMLFSLSSILAFGFKLLILIIYFFKYIDISTILMNAFSTIMFYPLIAYLNRMVQKKLLPQEGINE